MSPSLRAAQHDFLAAVLDGAPMRTPVQPRDAVEIHRGNVRASLRSALAATYPVVMRLVGPAFFDEAADRFARACPSRSGNLNAYGAAFDAFLASYPPARALAYLADVARLEWMAHESLGAAAQGSFDFSALSRVPPEAHGGIRFNLAPCVRLMRSMHPVVAIWEANQPERDGVPARDDGPDRVLVHRDASGIRVHALDEAQWHVLCALSRGNTLAHAGEALAGHAPGELPRILSAWTGAGVIASFEAAEGAA